MLKDANWPVTPGFCCTENASKYAQRRAVFWQTFGINQGASYTLTKVDANLEAVKLTLRYYAL